jgi:N-methylhydantoinase A
MPDNGWQVGIDIGGTFTDLVALKPATGELRSIKVPTQRNDPVASIKAALAAAGLVAIDVDDLVHGTTLVTNAIVEDRVEPVALIATEGFEDVLDIGRAGRQHLYRLDLPPKRAAQVPMERRISLAERVDHTGAAVKVPDVTALAEAVRQATTTGVESVAVSLLHAYANPAHERALGAALKASVPFVSLSHEVNPETREFERTATTVLNASVMPIAARYLDRLQREVQGSRLHVMHSAGGMASPEAAARRPLAMALSGPAAGISAAQHVAASLGLDKVLSFDPRHRRARCRRKAMQPAGFRRRRPHARRPARARVRHRRDRRAALLLGLLRPGLHCRRHELYPAAGRAHAEHRLGRRPLRQAP